MTPGDHWAHAGTAAAPLVEVAVIRVDRGVRSALVEEVDSDAPASWVPAATLRAPWSDVDGYRAAVTRWSPPVDRVNDDDAAAIRLVYTALPDLGCVSLDREFGPDVTVITDVEALATLTGLAPRILHRSPGAIDEDGALYVFGPTSRRLAMEVARARRTDIIGWILSASATDGEERASHIEEGADQTVLGWIGGPQLTEAEQRKVMAELDSARRKSTLVRLTFALIRRDVSRPMKKRTRKAIVQLADAMLRD